MVVIDPVFARRMVEVHASAGEAWLQRLPQIIAACEARWDMKVGRPFPLSYNYVAPATRGDGTPVVLKVGVPHPELSGEIAALRLYAGRGSARLLDADADQGILLLERLWPGTPLVTLADDEEATMIAARVMRELWRPLPPDHPFPTVAHWAQGMERLRRTFGGGTGPFPRKLVEEAESLFRTLLPSMAPPVLLHGDLHHHNILRAEREPWLALDPKGLAGEPAYEPGALLRNPLPGILSMPNLHALTVRRLALLSEELGIDSARIRGWGMAQAVLSSWWTYEDHGHVGDESLGMAQVLASLRE